MKLNRFHAVALAWGLGFTLAAGAQDSTSTQRPYFESEPFDPNVSEAEEDLDSLEAEEPGVEAELEETNHETHAIDSPEKDEMKSSASSASRAMNVPGAQQSRKTFPVLDSKSGGMGTHPFIGVNTGYQNVKGNVNSALGFGVDAGATLFGPVTAGLAIQYAPSDVDVGNLQANFDTTNYLAWANYNFGGGIRVIKDTFVGWKLGLSRYSGATEANTNLALGPTLGMNFQVDRAGKLTLGPEASYLTVVDAPDQASLQAALRYWF